MADIPLSSEAKITVERRGRVVLIGINRPQAHNRIDPDAFFGLAKAYYQFDNDPSLRAAVFFGHGENFSRRIDVDAFAPLARTGQPFAIQAATLESAHLSIDESEAAAFAKLNQQFGGLFQTADFIEGRKAEAQARLPV